MCVAHICVAHVRMSTGTAISHRGTETQRVSLLRVSVPLCEVRFVSGYCRTYSGSSIGSGAIVRSMLPSARRFCTVARLEIVSSKTPATTWSFRAGRVRAGRSTSAIPTMKRSARPSQNAVRPRGTAFSETVVCICPQVKPKCQRPPAEREAPVWATGTYTANRSCTSVPAQTKAHSPRRGTSCSRCSGFNRPAAFNRSGGAPRCGRCCGPLRGGRSRWCASRRRTSGCGTRGGRRGPGRRPGRGRRGR